MTKRRTDILKTLDSGLRTAGMTESWTAGMTDRITDIVETLDSRLRGNDELKNGHNENIGFRLEDCRNDR
jgi:hypothetical protein